MNEERRAELLERVTSWAIANGLHDLSLRPLASAIGTSARMLVYYFGSKELLTIAVLQKIATQWMDGLAESLDQSGSLDEALTSLWHDTLCPPRNRRICVLALEAWALGLSSRDPAYQPLLKALGSGWIDLIEKGIRQRAPHHPSARVYATLVVSAIDGLLLHRLTHRSLPIEDAFREFLKLLKLP